MAKKLRPIGNITVITGQYQKDGETKNRYLTIGTLFQRLDDNEQPTNRMTMKLDAMPIANDKGEVWVNIYPIQKRDSGDSVNQENSKSNDGVDSAPPLPPEDKPIDLSEIPF